MRRLLACLLLVGCGIDEQLFDAFDGPADVALLPPGGFFEVPTAVVSGQRSGRVAKLDLKRRGLLVEDDPAPWLPAPDLALGRGRLLGAIAAVEGADTVDVWVADDARDELLRAPWIDGRDERGKPRFARPRLGAVTAGSECTPELPGLRLREGRAGAELWSMTWDGQTFGVEGTISGPQRTRVLPGVPFETDGGELHGSVYLGGCEPPIGWTITVPVEGAVETADPGGWVTDLWVDAGSGWVLATVLPPLGDGFVGVWDAATFEELGRVALPPGARPEHLDGASIPGRAWVADSADVGGGGRALRLDYVPGDFDSIAVTALPLPEPIIDLAEGRDPASPRLFAGSVGSAIVWVLDPDTGALIDVNPWTAAVDGQRLSAPIVGLAATEDPLPTQQLDAQDTRLQAYGVVATTLAGFLHWLDAADGCQVFESPAGAVRDAVYQASVPLFTDLGAESDPALAEDPLTGRRVTTPGCGGIARTEEWTVRFDAPAGSWVVEGTRSGPQAGRAQEGLRYVSDEGAVSFLIEPGNRPATDGDVFRFRIDDGVRAAAIHEIPGDPVVYTELFDDRDGAWWKVRERPIAVIPHVANDVVLWVDIQGIDRGLRLYQ